MVKLIRGMCYMPIRAKTEAEVLSQAAKEYPYGLYALNGLVGRQVYQFSSPGMISAADQYVGVILPID